MTYRDKTQQKNCVHCGEVFYRDKRCTKKHWASAKFCSRSCSAQHGAKSACKTWGTLEERFWAKVERLGDDDCWNWIGASRPRGYGVISKNGRQTSATHVSLEIHGCDVPDGLWVLHKCDNPKCVNPKHLYIGNALQNSRDAVIRNRFKRKLTPIQAQEIYKSTESTKILSNLYGVSEAMIGHIKSGRKWGNVTK